MMEIPFAECYRIKMVTPLLINDLQPACNVISVRLIPTTL